MICAASYNVWYTCMASIPVIRCIHGSARRNFRTAAHWAEAPLVFAVPNSVIILRENRFDKECGFLLTDCLDNVRVTVTTAAVSIAVKTAAAVVDVKAAAANTYSLGRT